MGFFTAPSSVKKRKRTENSGPAVKKSAFTPSGAGKKKRVEDEEISSEEDDEGRGRAVDDSDDEEDEFADETAADKRRRLALQYLENTKAEIEEAGFNAEDVDRDILAERLKESVAEDKGRIYRHLADILSFSTASHSHFGNDTKALTGIAACHPYVYTVSKDRHLTKWLIPDPTSPAKKPKQVLHARCASKKSDKGYEGGHIDEILTIAASQDGKFIATGGRDNWIVVWNPETLTPLKIFKQHRSPVMGLVFRRNTNQMYSCSADRTVKSWSLDELAYVETLFGHQDEVVGITALANERCVTVGARDRTARLWKIVDETQLVFRGGRESKKRKASDGDYFAEGSMDCVAMIDEEHFVTGSDNGSISFWTVSKKKPIFTVPVAHGKPDPLPPFQYTAESTSTFPPPPPQPHPITALAAVPYSDTFFSGSYDGYVRVWKISSDKKRIEPVGRLGAPQDPALSMEVAVVEEGTGTTALSKTVTPSRTRVEVNPPARGVVNGISVFEAGEKRGVRGGGVAGDHLYVSVALGKEMRLGRWLKVPGKNSAVLFQVPRKETKLESLAPVVGMSGHE
ncbi:WD40-repeat-containing domain protein [Tirmania nivea]|nr:WD40-repeat-containing domain protein [Tirmania nivea]